MHVPFECLVCSLKLVLCNFVQVLHGSVQHRQLTETFAVLVLVFVVYNRRREAQIKYPGPDDDVRENIINYEDEGGGEDDMTAFDITPLQIPIADPSLAHMSLPRQKIPCKWATNT